VRKNKMKEKNDELQKLYEEQEDEQAEEARIIIIVNK